ncbi:MAG TPA: hypothetical protein VH500_23105 [Nitrososphaeraceae archaeon]|jgi:hypothetical protein
MINWGTITPVIVAIIGMSGFVVPAFSSVFINEIYKRPTINIDIGTEPEKDKQIINITNSGPIPATNLSLIITANNHIINNITNLFSTTNVFLVNPGPVSLLEMNHLKSINGLLLELRIKKLTNGGGSKIELAVGANGTTTKDYVVYAIYDQGSEKIGTEEPHINGITSAFVYLLGSGFLYLPLAESIVVIFIIYRVQIHKKRRFLDQIINQMMAVRKLFRHDPLYRIDFSSDPLYQTLTDTTWKSGPRGIRMTSRKTISDTNDYLRIDDFYSKLVERNSCIKNNQVIDDSVLEKLNRQCLELAENALEKVDWSKYR